MLPTVFGKWRQSAFPTHADSLRMSIIQGQLRECRPLSSFRFRLKRGKRVFPLVVCQLPNSASIGTHREQFAVRLRSVVAGQRLVLPPHTGTAEHDPLAVRGPHSVRVVASRVCQPPNAGAVRLDRVNLEIAVAEACKLDQVPFRRPSRKLSYSVVSVTVLPSSRFRIRKPCSDPATRYTIRFPSGDQLGKPAFPGPSVSLRIPEPSAWTISIAAGLAWPVK